MLILKGFLFDGYLIELEYIQISLFRFLRGLAAMGDPFSGSVDARWFSYTASG